MIVIDAAPGIALPQAIIVLIVEAAGITFAVPQPSVAQVTAPVPVTPLPLVPGFVDGLVGLGSAILPQIDLRRRLGLTAAESADGGELLVMLTADGNYALRVDHVVTLATLESDTVQVFAGSSTPGGPPTPLPETMLMGDALPQGVISGEFPWRQRTVLLLHPDRVGLRDLAHGGDSSTAETPGVLDATPTGLAAAPPAEPHHIYVLARCGPGRFALPVEQVAEVVTAETITPVPGANAEVLGLAQLRGRPVPVLIPAVMAPPAQPGPASGAVGSATRGVLMVINTCAGRFALLVDAVTGIQRFPLSRIHANTETHGTIEGRAGHLIDADHRVIGLLDADRLVTADSAMAWRGLLPPVETLAVPTVVVPTRHLLVFRLDTDWYAIDASLVMQLTGYREPMSVPETNKRLVGLVEIGADVLPVIDLRAVLGLPTPLDEWTAMIVVRHANVCWAVITDRIDRLVVVPETMLYPADAPVHRLVSAIVSLGDRLVSLLDLGPALHDPAPHDPD